ncbi:MAG TPA: hypothetical protein DEG88_14420 [Propionibacteriaceae bacterium]|nr:hypothetical protein [Propionibacteriaceae bacterium]
MTIVVATVVLVGFTGTPTGPHLSQALEPDLPKIPSSSPLAPSSTPSASATSTPLSPYDTLVLSHSPVAYWPISSGGGVVADVSGRGHHATRMSEQTTNTFAPNGDKVMKFDGVDDYLSIPSSSDFSIATTGNLTWEGWIRPSTLQFPHASSGDYVAWMGKCRDYAPSCEWEARMYSASNPQGRCSRLSAYAFNPNAGLGSGASWQPTCSLDLAGRWLHVVATYTTKSTPSSCSSAYPGQINIWVNGIPWNADIHRPTGCMSQYSIVPVAGSSPLLIGTMSRSNWFAGAIGKVAIYNRLLTQTEIRSHYKAMTEQNPVGSCGNTCTLC